MKKFDVTVIGSGSGGEIVNAMALGGQLGYIGLCMHIHPALTELILKALGNLMET
jgi:pyruvate/2-oxoglutarate dehydrogenase complex dihydrolipoamide dehydrogenase (E3) component